MFGGGPATGQCHNGTHTLGHCRDAGEFTELAWTQFAYEVDEFGYLSLSTGASAGGCSPIPSIWTVGPVLHDQPL